MKTQMIGLLEIGMNGEPGIVYACPICAGFYEPICEFNGKRMSVEEIGCRATPEELDAEFKRYFAIRRSYTSTISL